MMLMPMDEADAMELAERLVREVAKRGQDVRFRVAADIVLRTMETQRGQIVGFERAIMTGDLSGIEEQPSRAEPAKVAPEVRHRTLSKEEGVSILGFDPGVPVVVSVVQDVSPTVDNHTGAACHACFGGAGGLQRCDRCGVDVCGHCRVLGEQFAPAGTGKHYCGECADRLVILRAAERAPVLCRKSGQCVRPDQHKGECRADPVNRTVRQ